ncbi:hypothetical protein PN823_004480 [Enterobacter hormaechei]|nr:hypothetical protein [Enterobacter hormaechei]
MSETAKAKAIREAIEAIQCAETGETHPRLINYYERGLTERARRAAKQLPSPAEVPTLTVTHPLVLDWDEDRIGPGGALRND